MKYAEAITLTLARAAKGPPESARAADDQQTITLPLGLLGFETVKTYALVAPPEVAPFQWLQMAANPRLAFLVLPPDIVCADYHPEISEEEARFLGLHAPEDAWLFCIVTVHPDGRRTVNLKGPVVINRHTLVGKQIVPQNAAQFSVQHPLPVGPNHSTPVAYARARPQTEPKHHHR